MYATGSELRAHLLQPPSMDSNGDLVMPLRDSAFHRLLLHGVCQFYCLKSKVSYARLGWYDIYAYVLFQGNIV